MGLLNYRILVLCLLFIAHQSESQYQEKTQQFAKINQDSNQDHYIQPYNGLTLGRFEPLTSIHPRGELILPPNNNNAATNYHGSYERPTLLSHQPVSFQLRSADPLAVRALDRGPNHGQQVTGSPSTLFNASPEISLHPSNKDESPSRRLPAVKPTTNKLDHWTSPALTVPRADEFVEKEWHAPRDLAPTSRRDIYDRLTPAITTTTTTEHSNMISPAGEPNLTPERFHHANDFIDLGTETIPVKEIVLQNEYQSSSSVASSEVMASTTAIPIILNTNTTTTNYPVGNNHVFYEGPATAPPAGDFYFSSSERFPDEERSSNLWWALGLGYEFERATNLTRDDYLDYCANSPLLANNKQRSLCRSHPKVMAVVARGLRMAIEECQSRFSQSRWNCSLVMDEPNQISTEQLARPMAFGQVVKNPPASFEHKFIVIQAKLGDSIRLECNASGDQPLTVDWFREGTNQTIEKHGNELYDIHEQHTEWGLQSYMQIRAVKQEDALLYKCLASNEFGSSERLTKLIVLGVPEKPGQLRVRDVWSRSALVSWQPQYSASQRITNYTVQYWRKSLPMAAGLSASPPSNHRREEVAVDGLQSSALIAGLLPAVTYELSVVAHNQAGRSEPSETVNVTTSEEEPSAPPTDVQLESRGSSSLRVMWKTPPSENLNGKLLGFYIAYRPRYSPGPGLAPPPPNPAIQLQQPQQVAASVGYQPQSVIYSFKTADAVEGQLHYDTFLTNLKHNQEYEVTVRAFNKAGSGPDCHTLLGRTNSARLPQAPTLNVQRVTQNSISLKWTSTVLLASQRQPIQLASPDPLRYLLYYQLQGERDWYELSVGRPSEIPENQLEARQAPAMVVAEGSSSDPLVVGELIASQTSIHTLANLQPGRTYRIYVAAANDYGIGDPSNVITSRTEPPTSNGIATGSPVAFLLGRGALDGGSQAAAGLLDSWNLQPANLVYTIASSAALIVLLIALATYTIRHIKLRRRYNQSTGSSYPSSWTPAACDTIQSEYSVKRFPVSGLALGQTVGALATGPTANATYDEVPPDARSGGRQAQFAVPASQQQPANRLVHLQQFATSRQGKTSASATVARPLFSSSSHYYSPADLISGAGTLQVSRSISHRHQSSATLNRNQNRQLPPIPYSTLSVREFNGSPAAGSKTSWHHHQPPQPRSSQSMGQQNQAQSLTTTSGSQMPLIYGVVE